MRDNSYWLLLRNIVGHVHRGVAYYVIIPRQGVWGLPDFEQFRAYLGPVLLQNGHKNMSQLYTINCTFIMMVISHVQLSPRKFVNCRFKNIMDCIRQNHTYKLEHTMLLIAIQELPQQHLIIAVLHLEVAMRPKPFN